MWRGSVFVAVVMAHAVGHASGAVPDSGAVPEMGQKNSVRNATADAKASDAAVWLAMAPVISTLEPVRVQGEQLLTSLPAGTTITTRLMLDERAIDSWEDFSQRGEPGVNFNRENQSVNVRGMDADRVVTRVDGIRIPWLNDGSRGVKGGLETINFNTLSSIDLLRAAGATRSGALAGSLELYTLSPDDLLGQDKNKVFGALVKSGYDSADQSRGADAAFAGRFGPDTSWLLQTGHRKGHELKNKGEIGGYGADREKANPEDYTQQNVMLKLQHVWNTAHKVSLGGESFRRKAAIDNQREQGPGESYELGQNSTEKRMERDRVVLAYDYQSIHSQAALDRAEFKLYWQRARLESAQNGIRTVDSRAFIIPRDPFSYGYPSGSYGRVNSVEESESGLTTQWSGYVIGAVKQHWMAGAEWFGTRTEQGSDGYDNCPASRPGMPAPFGPRTCEFLHSNQADMPRVQGQQWSAWAQDEFSWADGKYALTPALRVDSYRRSPQSGGAYSNNPNESLVQLPPSSGQRFSPSLLASYKPSVDTLFYAKYGYGYKTPSATQLYMNYGGPGTYLRAGNPNLKPEISRGWELGVELGTEDLGGRLSLFDNRYRDFIEEGVPLNALSPEWNPAWARQYPMGVTAFANRARVRIYGAELSGHWKFNDYWYTWGALAWAQGRDQDTHQYLNSVAPMKALLALGYRADQWGAEGIVTLAKSRSKVQYPQATAVAPYPDYKTPGYGLLDFTAYWKPQTVKGLRLQAGLYNVFDKKYWNAISVPTAGASVIPMPIDSYTQSGRSVRVSVSYQY